MTPAEQIKSRLDVVTLIQSYLKLEKAGMNFKARCPFHSERSASFFVSPERGIWHCFGCGKGGDIFQFVMDMDGVEFPEALRTLAERTGVVLTKQNEPESSGRARLLALNEEAALFFQNNLESNEVALAYLAERGVENDTKKTFRLGFAPVAWRALNDHLKRKGFTEDEAERAGLLIRGEKGPYDRFRSRIIIPLEDALGRVIGFGGRIFDPDKKSDGKEVAKYINTPQTILYDKSRYLFGLNRAKTEIRSSERAVVVEGYFDQILSYQAGVINTVAVSGTALTEMHLGILRRFASSIIFAFDVDKAGIEATRRAVKLSYSIDFNVRIADIHGGKDPADIAAKNPDAWRQTVEEAKESIPFFLGRAARRQGETEAVAKKRIGEEILPMVASVASEIEKAHWMGELARILKVTESALWRELEKYRATGKVVMEEAKPAENDQRLTRKARLEQRILGMLLLEPTLASLGDIPAKQECSLALTGDLFEALTMKQNPVTIGEFIASLPPDLNREASRFLFEAEVERESIPDREGEFLSLLRSWKELSLKSRLEKLREEIRELEVMGRKDESKQQLKEFQEIAAHLARIVTLSANEKKEQTKKEGPR